CSSRSGWACARRRGSRSGGHAGAALQPRPRGSRLGGPVSAAAATASKPPIRHRKNVYLLSQPQRHALRDAFGAVEAISDNRGFQFYAGIHGVPGNFCIHHPPPPAISLFLPWHRAYLYFFELALRDQVPDATLAWWDWSSPRAH